MRIDNPKVTLADEARNGVKEEVRSGFLDWLYEFNVEGDNGELYTFGGSILSLALEKMDMVNLCYAKGKGYVQQLATEKNRQEDFRLYQNIEELAPQIIAQKRHIYKGVSPNVDFYSGFVYDMLGIPQEMYTAMFAIARIVGWSAHRIEELICMDKIIRPAYMSVMDEKED